MNPAVFLLLSNIYYFCNPKHAYEADYISVASRTTAVL